MQANDIAQRSGRDDEDGHKGGLDGFLFQRLEYFTEMVFYKLVMLQDRGGAEVRDTLLGMSELLYLVLFYVSNRERASCHGTLK